MDTPANLSPGLLIYYAARPDRHDLDYCPGDPVNDPEPGHPTTSTCGRILPMKSHCTLLAVSIAVLMLRL